MKWAVVPRLEQELAQWEEAAPAGGGEGGGGSMLAEQVTAAHISEVVSKMTGIPISQLELAEREKLLHLEAKLAQSVVGQERALSVVADAVRVSRAGLQPPDRPLGVFLLVGPTGVGKTQLCKALAGELFDSEEAVTRIDMTEYSERHSVSRLVGAPPGYVGYEEGGQLTEAVRRKPYSVVLLDEFEKAHKEVATLLLQVMDDGHLTDSQGKKVDFRSTIVVMTSNLGADALAAVPEGQASETARPQVMEAISAALPPEFVNRLDQIVLFNRLDRGQIRSIATIEIEKVASRLDERHVELHVSDDAVQWLAGAGYEPAYGARPVGRAVRQHLLNPLARAMLAHEGAADAASGGGGDAGGGGTSDEALHVVVDAKGENASLRIRVLPESEVEGALKVDVWGL